MRTTIGGVPHRGACDHRLVPTADVPDGLAALDLLLSDADSVSIAVAFVSASGAGLLREALRRHAVRDVALVARGAPVTDPDALIALRDDVGIGVSVVMEGDALRFHPKLWLARTDDRLTILSGSGNLTGGGLRGNREQFELLRVEVPSAAADAHERRFVELAAGALALEEVEGTAAWREWRLQLKQRRQLAAEQRRLDERLAATRGVDRTPHKQLLLSDLDALYAGAVDARLRRSDGQRYIPHRFREGIERARQLGDPVSLVGRMCHRQTEGFDVLLEADRYDLTVEALVVDRDKPYHSLFSAETRRRSRERLLQFPSWTAPG